MLSMLLILMFPKGVKVLNILEQTVVSVALLKAEVVETEEEELEETEEVEESTDE